MKKHEKEQLECDIKSNHLIEGQGLWECTNTLKYKIEHSKNIDNTEIKELLRKLTIVKEAVERDNNSINTYIRN
jgi:hypothetical protein